MKTIIRPGAHALYLKVMLATGCCGIAAVIAFCVAITRAPIAATAGDRAGTRLGDALAHCGRNSIVIYLAFSIFMAIARIVLIKFAGGLDGGVIAIASAVAGVSGALVLHLIVRRSMFAFLFERPQLFRVGSRPVPIGGAHAAGG